MVSEAPVNDVLVLDNYESMEWVKDHFFDFPWNRRYDLIESLVDLYPGIAGGMSERLGLAQGGFRMFAIRGFNRILTDEMSGYRFVSGISRRSPTKLKHLESRLR